MSSPNAIMSDLLIDDGDITDAEFLIALGSKSSVGYSDFKTFIPGDYSYQNALFKTCLKSADESRPQLRGLSLSVDVPDVFDRGVNTIGASGTTINFARTFNVAPEVVATIKGGAGNIPKVKVSNISVTSFDVDLEEGGVGVSGDITWAAQGY